MDKKLLESFDNLSKALEGIAEALRSKAEPRSASAQAIQQGDFIKEIKEINVSVKDILKDTKKIIADQQTIMNMGKSKSKGADVTEELGKDKKKQGFFKEGIGIILLIAVAVLALGAAFKIIGDVNFKSVIALSIAIPLLALAFERVVKTLEKTKFNAKKDGLNFILTMGAIAVSVLITSVLLSMVRPIGMMQLISATFTVAILTVMATKLENILIGVGVFSRLRIKPWKVTIALAAIAAGITAASYALALVKPIGFSQAISAILIAGTFAVLGSKIEGLLIGVGVFSRLRIKPWKITLTLSAIAAGITAASYILSYLKPISLAQSTSAILIAVMFSVIGFSMHKIGLAVVAFQRLKVSPLKLVVTLSAIASAITASSYVLSLIRPLSFAQAITGILISAMFLVISFNLEKIALGVVAFKRTKVSSFSLVSTLVGISLSIAISSWILSTVKPLNLMQFLTALGIAILFALMSYVMDKLAIGIAIIGKVLGASKMFLIPLTLVFISMAIYLSSKILAKTVNIPLILLLKILILGAILAVLAIALVIPIVLMSKFLTTKDLIFGSFSLIIISGAIALSSILLNKGEYKNYPDYKWALGVGLSFLGFIPAIVALGVIAMTGVGAVAILAGAGLTLLVAGTIVATSQILSKGKYDGSGNMLLWALGTTLLYATFVPILLVLGAVGLASSVISFFGPDPWEMARKMIVQVAQTIVDVSFVLSKGNYKDGPTKNWAGGVALSLAAFTPLYAMLMANGVLKIFGGGGLGPEDFSQAIKTVSEGIIYAAKIFASPENPGVWKGGPTKEWAEGVGKAIGAFSPVLSILAQGSILELFGGRGVDAKAMKSAIKTISEGIVEAAEFFSKNSAPFSNNYPKKQWGEGVGAALAAFAPVFTRLKEGSGWFTSGKEVIEEMKFAIGQVTLSLIDTAIAFSSVSPDVWKTYPSDKWAKGVEKSVSVFMDILSSGREVDTKLINLTISQMVKTASILYRNRRLFELRIAPDYMKRLSANVRDFASLAKFLNQSNLEAQGGIRGMLGLDPVSRTAKGMMKMANAFDALARSLDRFSKALKTVDKEKINVIRKLTANIAILSSMDSVMFNRMLTVLETRASVFGKLLDVQGRSADLRARPTVGDRPPGQKPVAQKSKDQGPTDSKGENALVKLDRIADLLSKINSVTIHLDEYLGFATETAKKQEKQLKKIAKKEVPK